LHFKTLKTLEPALSVRRRPARPEPACPAEAESEGGKQASPAGAS